jgi:hypothetical protein
MSGDALFGLSILMSFLAFAIVTKVYIWPRLRVMHRTDALIPLVIPHTFRYLKTMDPLSRKYTGKPFPMRSLEGRVALVIEVDKARYTKLPFTHTPPPG